MTRVRPFAGLRFAPSVVGDLANVVCPPYDVVPPEQQRALQQQIPYNVIRVELPVDAAGREGSRYEVAAEHLRQWQEQGALVRDARPAFYLHETRFQFRGASHVRRDLIAALGVEPWSESSVLPHEHTFAGPKADRLALLRTTHTNVSPIWVLHREDHAPLRDAWQSVGGRAPDTQLALDGEEHRLWVLDDPALVAAVEQAFAAGGPLYIADGHHRYETTLAFRNEVGESLPGAADTLAVITWSGDPGLLVLPTHRILPNGAAGQDRAALLARLGQVFDVQPARGDARPDALEEDVAADQTVTRFALLGPDGSEPVVLRPRDPAALRRAMPADHSEAWKGLDVAMLHTALLEPLLEGVAGERDALVRYTRDPGEAAAAVRQGSGALAFLLPPTRVEQVLDVADAHDRMPEKSTYFYPKPPTGLVLRGLDQP